MHGVVLILASGLLAPPAYAYLSPVRDVWQVWASVDGGRPRPITRDARDKVSLSAAERAGVLLAVTRDGEGLILSRDGRTLGVVSLGAGAREAALAPDGRRVAFAREEPGRRERERRLWILDPTGGAPLPLAPRPGMQHSPSFAPDGSALAFTMAGENGSEDLWWVRLDGSDDRQLTTGPYRHFEPDIAPDGGVYVSSDRGGDYDIWRHDPGGLEARPVIVREGYDGEPRVSPDGARILFVSRRAGRGAVWVAGADGTGARRLTGESADVRDPVWLPAEDAAAFDSGLPVVAAPVAGMVAVEREDDGGWIAFLRVTEGSWQPWATHPDGSGLKRLATLPSDVTRITLSADGRILLADCIDGALYLVATTDGAARRVEVDPGGPTDAALSADGRRIVYSVNTLGGIDSNDLWLAPAQGGRAKKITDQPFLQHFPSWGPDGDIVYLSGRGGQAHDIWRVSAGGGTPKRIVGDRLYNFEPAVSARGDIAFSSNREGDYEIWILPAGAGEPRRLTRDPAYDGQPTFSPDAGRIAFLSRRGGSARIWIHDLASGKERPLAVDGEVRLPFWYGGAPAGTVPGSRVEGR